MSARPAAGNLGRRLALVHRFVRQHRLTNHVSDGEDVGYVGTHLLIDFDKTTIQITQETNYPWSGEVKLSLELPQPTQFTLRLRIPGWARNQPTPSDLYHYIEAPSSASPPCMTDLFRF